MKINLIKNQSKLTSLQLNENVSWLMKPDVNIIFVTVDLFIYLFLSSFLSVGLNSEKEGESERGIGRTHLAQNTRLVST